MTKPRPRVVYWNSQPTPYMVERWNAVADRGNIEMHAWFNVVREPDRSWEVDESAWRFQGRYLTTTKMGGRQVYLPPPLRETGPLDLIVQEYASPSMALGFFVSRGLAKRVAFRALPTYDAWVSRSRPKEALKHVLFRSADGAKTAGKAGTLMIHRYGMPVDRIHTVTQSIDYPHFASALNVDGDVVQECRRELGVSGCVFLYVGRLWHKKGLTDLFDAFELLQNDQRREVSLIVAGDGVDEVMYRERARRLKNVILTGFVQRSALPALYAVADAFVFPTHGDPHGLVVEEAMAAGLPVICTEAAGDIERRLPHGQAGFIVPVNDVATLAERMIALEADSGLRDRMAQEANRIARLSDHDHYARDFEAFVEATISNRPRSAPVARVSRIIGRGINVVRR